MNHQNRRMGSVFLPIKIVILILPILLFFSCASSEDKYGLVDLFHGKPKLPRMIPRQVLGDLPSGPFQSQQVKGVLVLDTGADFEEMTGLTYLVNLLRRYRTTAGFGDLPFHYFIEPDGKIFAGRQENVPAELHEGDPFTARSADVERKDLLLMRLNRRTKPLINLEGYITIVLLGDYDRTMVNEAQEKSMFQLIAYFCFDHYIPLESVKTLQDVYPETKNPGFYLRNYFQIDVLTKNIPPVPKQPGYLIVPETKR